MAPDDRAPRRPDPDGRRAQGPAGRELQIHGSARLGSALLAAGLVDTLRLVVAPTVIGAGRRLLAHPGDRSACGSCTTR